MRYLILLLVSSTALAQSKTFETEDLQGTITLKVFRDGPGFTIDMDAGYPEDYAVLVELLEIAESEANTFLAEHRWCMNGYTLNWHEGTDQMRLHGTCTRNSP